MSKSIKALEYLTSEVFTGGNSILIAEADECKKIILQDLEELNKLKTLVKNNCVGFTLEQVVEKGLYQIYLEQMCDIMCPEPEEEEEVLQK